MDTKTYLQLQQQHEQKIETWLGQFIQLLRKTCPQFDSMVLEPQFLRYMLDKGWADDIPTMKPENLWKLIVMWEELHTARQEATFLEDGNG